jgi:hypothetical protein
VGILTFDDVVPIVSAELAGLARLIGVQARAPEAPRASTEEPAWRGAHSGCARFSGEPS